MKRMTMWVGLIIFCTIALPAFGQQIGADSVQPKAEEYFNKGVELYEAKDYPAAVAAFGKALELKTDYLEAEYNLAITYWTQKDYPKTVSTLESLVKKTPDTDIGKKAVADLQKLKAFNVPVVVPQTTEETEEAGKEVDVALKSVPKLIADLKFGLLTKRLVATDQLKKAETDEAIDALIKFAFNEDEKLSVRISAIQNLAQIKKPKTLSIIDQVLAGTSFTTEVKLGLLVSLANQNTPETFKIILKYWFLEEWPSDMKSSPGIQLKKKAEWPPELNNQRMWTMTKTLGREKSLPLFISSWPGIVETTDNLIPTDQRDYIFYYNLMTGFLKGALSVPVLAQRLKEDYPENYPVSPQLILGELAPPGGPPNIRPILKSSAIESQSWTVENEIKLRVEMIEVLGGVAGESQGPFLEYLALNDPKTAVRGVASEAFKSLNTRVVQSKENYDKGLKLLASGNRDEALSLFEQALKENFDAPYRKNINKTLIPAGIQFLAKGNKERATPLLMPLYQLLSEAITVQKKTADSKQPGLTTPGTAVMGGLNTSAAVLDQAAVEKLIRDQLAVLEIPSASATAQDIKNIYDLGLELEIIKQAEDRLKPLRGEKK